MEVKYFRGRPKVDQIEKNDGGARLRILRPGPEVFKPISGLATIEEKSKKAMGISTNHTIIGVVPVPNRN